MTTTGQLLREMFTHMVIAKNANVIDTYYHPDFLLHTNGTIQDLEEFRAGHARVYPTQISYAVEFDDTSWIRPPIRWARGSGSPRHGQTYQPRAALTNWRTTAEPSRYGRH
jgi:hypothetical protein